MSIYESLKKVFSELVQKLGLLLKCCKSGKKEGKDVTEVKKVRIQSLVFILAYIIYFRLIDAN